jgi:hypothetical protein
VGGLNVEIFGAATADMDDSVACWPRAFWPQLAAAMRLSKFVASELPPLTKVKLTMVLEQAGQALSGGRMAAAATGPGVEIGQALGGSIMLALAMTKVDDGLGTCWPSAKRPRLRLLRSKIMLALGGSWLAPLTTVDNGLKACWPRAF